MNAVSVPVNKVLVTGANGFIGGKLCNELARRGYSVVRAVRQTPLTNDENVEYTVVGDMDEPIDWMPVLSGVITVVHLMARVHKTQETSIQSIDKYRQTNVYATERLARDSAQAGVRRFVFVSSIKVNGEATKLNEQFSELDVPNPQGPYAVSKWEAEQILNQVACETGMEVVIVRPPMVYGPSVGGNFLRLMRLISWGIPLPLATINNQRSMIYLGNFVDALVVCANHPGATGKTYLVSDGKDVSTSQLMRDLARLMEKPSLLWPFPTAWLRVVGKFSGKSDEIERLLGSLQIDSSRIQRELGWVSPFTMEQGLAETVMCFQARDV